MYSLTIEQKKKITRIIIIGLIGAILSLIGDFLLMAFDTNGATMMDSYFKAAELTSYTRIGLAAFFGYIGIPLSDLGYLSLCSLTKQEAKQSKIYHLYRYYAIVFAVLGGGVHILCCFILTGLKKNFELGIQGNEAMINVYKELGGALIPCVLLFLIIFSIMVIAQILLIYKKKTYLPKWFSFINPFTFKILLNMSKFLGTSAFANGISCSNMSLGCALILLSWLIAVNKK